MNALVTIDHENATPIVSLKGAQIVANSRDVATYFEKRHNNVLRDIYRLLEEAPEALLSFEQGVYRLETKGSQEHRCFDMTPAEELEVVLRFFERSPPVF